MELAPVRRACARAITAVAVLALFAIPAAAQAPAAPPAVTAPGAQSPRAALEAFFAALARADGASAAALVDSASLAAYREQQLATVGAVAEATDGGRTSMGRTGGISVSALTPGLEAKYAAMPIHHVPGVATLGELAALPPAEFMARMVAGAGPVARALAGGGKGAAALEVVGEVFEGDSLAHVVYRSAFTRSDNPLVPRVSVMSARRSAADGRWRLLPDLFVIGQLRPPQMLSREF